MPAPDVQREAAKLASRLMFDTRALRGVDRGLWERWPVRKAVEIDLARWVEKELARQDGLAAAAARVALLLTLPTGERLDAGEA